MCTLPNKKMTPLCLIGLFTRRKDADNNLCSVHGKEWAMEGAIQPWLFGYILHFHWFLDLTCTFCACFLIYWHSRKSQLYPISATNCGCVYTILYSSTLSELLLFMSSSYVSPGVSHALCQEASSDNVGSRRVNLSSCRKLAATIGSLSGLGSDWSTH